MKKDMMIYINKNTSKEISLKGNKIYIGNKEFNFEYECVASHAYKIATLDKKEEFRLILTDNVLKELFGYRAREVKNVFLPINYKQYLLMFKEQNVFRKYDIMIATALMIRNKELRNKINNTIFRNEYLSKKLLDFKMWNFTIDLSDSDFIYKNFSKILKKYGIEDKLTPKQTFLSRFKIFGKIEEPYAGFNLSYDNKIFSEKVSSNLYKEILEELQEIEEATGVNMQKAIQEIKKAIAGKIDNEQLSSFFYCNLKDEKNQLLKFIITTFKKD